MHQIHIYGFSFFRDEPYCKKRQSVVKRRFLQFKFIGGNNKRGFVGLLKKRVSEYFCATMLFLSFFTPLFLYILYISFCSFFISCSLYAKNTSFSNICTPFSNILFRRIIAIMQKKRATDLCPWFFFGFYLFT